MRDVGIIYLWRFAEGEQPVRRFLQTYREHTAGIEHDLYVIFKGFPDKGRLELGRALFAGISINSIELDDKGFDIGSYVAAAKLVSNRRLIFLNTFSQILGDDWLRHFDRALTAPGVGLVGSTGSWLSRTSGYEGALRRVFCRIRHLPTFLRGLFHRPKEDNRKGSSPIRKRGLVRYLRTPFHYLYCIFEYERFPNPHIRTNAFMIDRNKFLSLTFPTFREKEDVYRFESGRQSLTRQVVRQGLQPVVVGRNGSIFATSEWKSSATFWSDEQANLLIADNRTCAYSEGNKGLREYLEDSAWVNPWSWRTGTGFSNPSQ
jgi:hypothetical protein